MANSTTEKAILTAPDISCAHCVATVKEAVGGLEGVRQVDADAETKEVTVTFDPAQVSRSRIEAALDEAGYPAQSDFVR